MASEPLALTTGRHRALATRGDHVRQVVVLVGALVAVAGAAVGSGAAGGTPIAEAADGALSADATVVAPAGPAFGIWSVIYLGLLAAAVHQALPRHATNPRLRATSWWVLASMLLNAAWIGVVQAGWLWASVAVIAALVAVLCVVVVRYVRLRPARGLEAWLYQGTVGLYLGWVCVATLADVAATLSAADVGELGLGATVWGVVLVGLGAVVIVALAVYARTRGVLIVATGLAAAWGLGWIAYGRFQGPLVDETVAIAASTAAAIALCAPIVAVVSRPPRPQRRGATVVIPGEPG
ncbi:TspO/MBR related protein [Sediminihabitans luteus]|uniref:TspO/MBR related protein n=1 Tax=Sediminihabitans luteus TaxID=1138585 RepID=A0A2M9CDJ7_9CELL|nr:tryptophan-rich sensory protein [Sediminihabitans luteus]PJJ69948.1 TspO/MBR related protein [Sediminihabitans luteus]GII99268.1 tryptophan-rich sensory protein [Sediminihabitans luteus]